MHLNSVNMLMSSTHISASHHFLKASSGPFVSLAARFVWAGVKAHLNSADQTKANLKTWEIQTDHPASQREEVTYLAASPSFLRENI